jgi:hypothetical protein
MIRRLLLGLVIATFAGAQVQAQEPARAARADFQGKSAPAPVRRMADWVVASADNGSLAFAIIDKKEAEVFVFDSQGQILDAAPALLGLGVGDDSAPGVGNKPLSAIRPQDRTTPAGRFNAFLGHERGHPDFFWVDYKNAVALHRVVKGTPKDRRAERLASPTPLDNRITFGCINVPVAFFEQTVLPAFKGTKGIVYILPEVKAMRDFFPKYYDVDQ